MIEELLRQAEKQGELLPGTDMTEVASTLVGAFTGLQVMSQAYTNRQDLPARISALWRLQLPGLAAPGMLPRLRTSGLPEAEELQRQEPSAAAGHDGGPRAGVTRALGPSGKRIHWERSSAGWACPTPSSSTNRAMCSSPRR
ncbi:hypothetical protein OH768_05860 [Streptomyces sp. NBC_01622]|uniref:hypothetical protein n=1 Tax=Streptomyces sp. NBC_01622 TaxID=2975903 RepID=UPI00386B927F|nr:hypothetical protein OH768_05860 [Streptomyces sp. NBC_01622]